MDNDNARKTQNSQTGRAVQSRSPYGTGQDADQDQDRLQIDTSGLEPAAVLVALYRYATIGGVLWQNGLPVAHVTELTVQEARDLFADAAESPDNGPLQAVSSDGWWVDYLKGVPIKSTFYPDTVDATGFDREYKAGNARAAIEQLKAGVYE
ncbi:hypothetical protein [Streptacidiphilus sp. EB103A]|uniref:hypothetical protein n=1 Tax=Streptacidiphilus sp. EB103A TaxID=3156275 RepID=UPI003514D09E